MPKTPTKSQLERRTALALLEVQELRANFDHARGVGDLKEMAKAVEGAVAALQQALDVPYGLRVEQAAKRLAVSKPTVKKWIDEGFLAQVPDRSPIEVRPESVVQVERVLDQVREQFPARLWSEQLAAFLHDRDLQRQDWFREGVAQGKRSEYVEL